MFEPAVIVLRWVQMMGAMILFGSSLFFIYGLPKNGPCSAAELRWSRPILILCAATVLTACVLGFIGQTAILAGSLADALTFDSLNAALSGMSFGKSSAVRAIAAALALLRLPFIKPGQGLWRIAATAGAVICASFAWMGHGAATPGAAGMLHAASDIVHTLAAGVWIGALIAFLLLLVRRDSQAADSHEALHSALRGFSGIGSALVAVLVATGLINSWFVVGLPALPRLWATLYGQLLTAKLVLFVAMLGLAAINRFRLTPALAVALQAQWPTPAAIAGLRKSVAMETAISVVVLALVAWFGTLAPPSVQ